MLFDHILGPEIIIKGIFLQGGFYPCCIFLFLQMQAYTDTVYSLKFFNVKFYHINDLSSW